MGIPAINGVKRSSTRAATVTLTGAQSACHVAMGSLSPAMFLGYSLTVISAPSGATVQFGADAESAVPLVSQTVYEDMEFTDFYVTSSGSVTLVVTGI
jgi:ABC-type sulfate transport system permease component